MVALNAVAFDGQDAYGPGVHMDRYGRAVTFGRPDVREVEIDAYGPGVHSDEYGRPLSARPIGSDKLIGPFDLSDD
jgi:hypothetical protein